MQAFLFQTSAPPICQPPKGKKCKILRELGKVVHEKWVKSREMSQISWWKELQWGLWVLEVTYLFKAWEVNITINFMI